MGKKPKMLYCDRDTTFTSNILDEWCICSCIVHFITIVSLGHVGDQVTGGVHFTPLAGSTVTGRCWWSVLDRCKRQACPPTSKGADSVLGRCPPPDEIVPLSADSSAPACTETVAYICMERKKASTCTHIMHVCTYIHTHVHDMCACTYSLSLHACMHAC